MTRAAPSIPPDRIKRLADFRAALRAFERHVEQAARRNGLTPQRFLLLLQIEGAASGNQPIGVGEVAERLQLSPNTATELVTRAEEAGLVAREPSPDDRRAVRLRVTPRGYDQLEATLVEAESYREELRAAFDQLVDHFERSV